MSRSAPNPLSVPRSQLPAGGVGVPDTDVRAEMLEMAGVTQARQAEAVKRSFDKKVSLLEAERTVFAPYQGELGERAQVAAIDVQLKAAEAIDRMVGVLAPPTTRKVTVVHTLEWPAWYRPEGAPATVTIEAPGREEAL